MEDRRGLFESPHREEDPYKPVLGTIRGVPRYPPAIGSRGAPLLPQRLNVLQGSVRSKGGHLTWIWGDLSVKAALVPLGSPGTLSDTSPGLGYCVTSKTNPACPNCSRSPSSASVSHRTFTVLSLQGGEPGSHTPFSGALACP